MLQLHSEAEPSGRLVQLSDESLITGRQLRTLLGNCSEMHVWRLLKKPKLQPLAFPKPLKINGRNYWRLGAVRRWFEDQEIKSRELASATQPNAASVAAPRRHPQGRRKHR
jgi:predicted DNA-binding transcriptional regulator AlpA